MHIDPNTHSGAECLVEARAHVVDIAPYVGGRREQLGQAGLLLLYPLIGDGEEVKECKGYIRGNMRVFCHSFSP